MGQTGAVMWLIVLLIKQLIACRHRLWTPNEAFFHKHPKLGKTIWANKFWGIWGTLIL